MEEIRRSYIPAAGHDWRLPLYDPMVRLLGGNPARQALLDRAALRAGHRVLDVGCGTGTLVVLIKRLHPGVEVVGLDPDPKALARARRKVARAAVEARLDQGYSDTMPYESASFDRVFSSFVLHHLRGDEKQSALREIRRVLKPGGSLHLLDFARPEPARRGPLTRWLHSSHRLGDNTEARVHTMMREAGLADARTVGHGALLVWRTAYYEALAPATPA